MSKYSSWPTTDEGNVIGGRLKVEVRNRFSSMSSLSAVGQRDAALTELLAGTSEVFNVKSYGAKGDDSTDDTAALQAAVDAARDAYTTVADMEGAIVFLPPGQYRTSADLEIPMGVKVLGSGSRCTAIKWLAGNTITEAVITSNLTGQYGNGFAHAVRIEGIRIKCLTEALGMSLRGWNESCGLDDVEVSEFATTGIFLDAVTQPSTNVTQHTGFNNIRLVPQSTATSGLRLRDVRKCLFANVTIDQPSSATAPCDVGILLDEGCNVNTFQAIHVEDCSVAVEIGPNGACDGNTFIGLDFNCTHTTPDDQTVGSLTSESIGVLVQSGCDEYAIIGMRDGYGYDNIIYDVDKDVVVTGVGSGGGVTFQQLILGADNDVFLTDSQIKTRKLIGEQSTITSDTDALDVANVNSVAVTTSSGTVTIGGIINGVKGQRVTIFKKTSANNLVIENNESAGNQDIFTADGVDITLGTLGGVTLEFDGTNWFVISQ